MKEAIVYLLSGMESLLQCDVNYALQHGEPQYVYHTLSAHYSACHVYTFGAVHCVFSSIINFHLTIIKFGM